MDEKTTVTILGKILFVVGECVGCVINFIVIGPLAIGKNLISEVGSVVVHDITGGTVPVVNLAILVSAEGVWS